MTRGTTIIRTDDANDLLVVNAHIQNEKKIQGLSLKEKHDYMRDYLIEGIGKNTFEVIMQIMLNANVNITPVQDEEDRVDISGAKRICLKLILFILILCFVPGCRPIGSETKKAERDNHEVSQEMAFSYEEYSLKRKGVDLHLDCMKQKGANLGKNILLIHGVTYSSHEFDLNYKDYSLVRFLASKGYAVWRLDIAGFGQSEEVKDGFLPDSDYAALDINEAVNRIVRETGQEKIDVLGWSWGTVTVSRFAANHNEHVNKLVLYAPILSGLGENEVTEAFHHNDWEHAADDFQKEKDGSIDYEIVDPIVVDVFCSNCWRYDGERSPNGGRRDICVQDTDLLIDLSKIKNPTLVICGDQDPYLNYDLVKESLSYLPKGSELEMIKGGSHVVYIEKPYYRDFQNRLNDYLNGLEKTE